MTNIQFNVIVDNSETDTPAPDQIILTYLTKLGGYLVSQKVLFNKNITLTVSEPVYTRLPAQPVGFTAANLGNLVYIASTYFSDNRIYIDGFSNCPKSGAWVHRGTTYFNIKNVVSIKANSDLSDAKLNCYGEQETNEAGKLLNFLKCTVATRGVYSFNLDLLISDPTLDSATGVSALPDVQIIRKQALFNPVNYLPYQVQRYQDNCSITYIRDKSQTGLNEYLS
jgi:hypothetical protein